MANFSAAYRIARKNEGGYVNDPADKGGETYKGVARNFNPSWPGWLIIDEYKRLKGPIKKNTIIANTKLDLLVEGLFKKNYWDRMQGDTINSQKVADIFFDMFINSGKAARVMQASLNTLGKNIPLDNTIGTKTILAINATPSDTLHDEFKKQRIAYYKSQAGVSFDDKFLKGLLVRVNDSFPDLKKKAQSEEEQLS